MIEALERHTNVSYTKDEKTVEIEIADAYEITSRKPRVTIHRPIVEKNKKVNEL